MDPLSLTVSILTILGTGGIIAKGFGKVRGLKDAPAIVFQLNNEVSDLTLLVRAVDEAYRLHGLAMTSSTHAEVVYNVLKRAQNVVLDLEKLVDHTLTKPTSSGSRVSRRAWINSLSEIKTMKTSIHITRDELITLWAALGNRYVRRIMHRFFP